MSDKNQKTVGIIGGMGPEATVELMRRVIELTPANDDCDHIHMLVDNNPKVPSRIKALIDGDGESPLPVLIKMAQGLEKSGADFLVMPCNTAHYYYAEIAASVSIPFINMIELTAKAIKSDLQENKTVGLLSSTAVVNLKLYSDAFAKLNLETVCPDENNQENLMTVIKAVKSNSINSNLRNKLCEVANSLNQKNSDCLLIACTEISTLATQLDESLVVIDALQVLAQEIVKLAH